MKQFIVLLAVLPLMLIFMVQFTLNQKIETKIAMIDSYVYTAKENARQKGCFTEEIQNTLKEQLCSIQGVDIEDVYIKADISPKKRISEISSDWTKSSINYEVRVTLGAIMAGADFLGIKKEDNNFCYVIKSYAASEYIVPE